MTTTITVHQVERKDPSERKVYSMDWGDELSAGETIASSSWSVSPAGLTMVSDNIIAPANTITSVLLADGDADVDYECTNTITTSGGQTLVRTGELRVREI